VATHVKVIAGLCIVSGAFWALWTFAAPLVLTVIAAFVASSGDPDAAVGTTVLGLTGVWLGVMFGVLAVANIVVGVGLWKFRKWARIAGIILAVLSLINFPFGTAFGIYALIILFRKDTEALFV
jgi:hypothetical protein